MKLTKPKRKRKSMVFAEKVRDTWDMFEAAEPDISTERLIAMVGDYCKCDASDVCEALFATGWGKEA